MANTAAQNIAAKQSRGIAVKDIPMPAVLATQLWANIGSTGAETGLATGRVAVVDLDGIDEYHQGLIRFEVKTQNGVNGTPTTPGAGKTLTLSWAFTSDALPTTGKAPTTLGPAVTLLTQTLVCPIANTAAANEDGLRYYGTSDLVVQGGKLYFWIDLTAFADNTGQINATVNVIRI